MCCQSLNLLPRIQVLSYDPSSDTIEIVHYNRKSAQNDPTNIYTYRFMVYSRVNEVRSGRGYRLQWPPLNSSLMLGFCIVGICPVSTNIQEVRRPLQVEQGRQPYMWRRRATTRSWNEISTCDVWSYPRKL